MRFFLIAALSLFVFASSAHAQDLSAQCSLKILFGSYAKGIDVVAYDNIRTLLDESKEVRTYDDISWGSEGERAFCVKTFSMQATDLLYGDVLRFVPAVSRQAWVEVMHEDGRSQRTQWPR